MQGTDMVGVGKVRAESKQKQNRGKGMAGKTRAGQTEPGQGIEGHNRGRTGAAIEQGQDRGRFWAGYGRIRAGQGQEYGMEGAQQRQGRGWQGPGPSSSWQCQDMVKAAHTRLEAG